MLQCAFLLAWSKNLFKDSSIYSNIYLFKKKLINAFLLFSKMRRRIDYNDIIKGNVKLKGQRSIRRDLYFLVCESQWATIAHIVNIIARNKLDVNFLC